VSAPTGPLLLRPQAEGLLAEVVAFYDANDVELPDRRIIAPGAPGQIAWDCDQVSVALAGVTTGSAAGQVNVAPQLGAMAGVGLPRFATWSVQVIRCTPNPDEDGNPPPAEKLNAAGAWGLVDVGLLSQCFVLMAATAISTQRDWLPIGGTINAGQVASLGPQGGYHGYEALVTLTAMEAL
jgi:hypothetical protein